MNRHWIDISRPICPPMPTWPGDPPTLVDRAQDQARGDCCTLTRLSLCVHSGTHLDAPLHYLPGGADMDAWPLAAGLGRARVVEAEGPVVTRAALSLWAPRRGERLLIKTANSRESSPRRAFTPDFVALDLEAARYLAMRRVLLVGLDGPSVGPPDEPDGVIHRALLGAGIWILENLDLAQAPAGPADLACLPLRLAGAEAAPVRAVLRPVGRAPGP